MKFLSILFVIITVTMTAVSINTYKQSKTIKKTETVLDSDVKTLKEKLALVFMFTNRMPEKTQDTYSNFLAKLISYNQELNLQIRVRIKGIEDYQTIMKAVKPSEITGVKRLVFLLDSPSKLPTTLYVVSELQKEYPVLFQELQYGQKKMGVIFSLYGI